MLNKELRKLIENSNLFDRRFYLKEYGDARTSKLTPIKHYVKFGLDELRKPNAEFDPVWYKKHYEDLQVEDINPLVHYIVHGMAEGRCTNEREFAEYTTVKDSSLFDEEYYLEQNEDVKESEADPILHYVRSGYKESRKPNVEFDPLWYKEHYEDLQESEINLFVHYIVYGRLEGRFINEKEVTEYTIVKDSGQFDYEFYSKVYDSTQKDTDLIKHYIQIGWKEGKQPNPWFSSLVYLELNLDVKEASLEPFSHYLVTLESEERIYYKPIKYEDKYSEVIYWLNSSDGFDRKYYLTENYDISISGVDPLEHYLRIGWEEGRNPNSWFDIVYYLKDNRCNTISFTYI